MEQKTLEERVERLETLQQESGAVAVAVHGLLVALMRMHPHRDAIVEAFTDQREQFMALALNSSLPTDA